MIISEKETEAQKSKVAFPQSHRVRTMVEVEFRSSDLVRCLASQGHTTFLIVPYLGW